MNPNPYDEEKYIKASDELFDSVAGLWEAGATKKGIEEEFKDALRENVGVEQ